MAAIQQDADAHAVPTIFDPATCTRRGFCPVTSMKKNASPVESHSLYFEQHGSGPVKILFIMGLNSTSFTWYQQVAYFGRKPEYSILVFDNRGIGNSGVPMGPYTTSGMSEDVIALLDYVGWTAKRDLNVVSVSLGGMIAQELATRIPERIVSLTLAVTRARGKSWSTMPSSKGLVSLTRMLITTNPYDKIPISLNMLFPQAWLDSPAPNDPAGRTNRQVQMEEYRKRFDVTRPQKAMGTLSQMAAAVTHTVSPPRLRTIAVAVPKVLIIVGDEDNVVDPAQSRYIHENMPGSELVVLPDTGHGIAVQRPAELNAAVERAIHEGRERLAKAQEDAAAQGNGAAEGNGAA